MRIKNSALAVTILCLGAVIVMTGISGGREETKINGAEESAEGRTQGEAVFRASEEEYIRLFNQWVNTTRNRDGELTVHRKEDFDVNVTECTGGSIGSSALNKIISLFIKPSDEILMFSDGKGTAKDGKTVSLLLPLRGSCCLTSQGVSQIKKYREDGSDVIYIKLVKETAGLNEKPAANSSCAGYLDTGSINMTMGKITDITVDYTGTEITAKANDKGYIEQIEYTVPFEATGKAKIGLVQCQGSVTGTQREAWIIKW